MDKEYRIITKIRLMNYLDDKGIKYLYSRPDIKNPYYYVWVYKRTEELQQTIEEYYDEVQKILNKF